MLQRLGIIRTVTPRIAERLDELASLIATGRAREIREGAGLSRATLARDLDVDQLTIARWEGGATPRRGNALRYLKLLRQVERMTETQRGAGGGQ